ncbi:MAG: SIR2 family protein [Bacillota bacterium]
MSFGRDKFYKYPKERDVVFVFGTGASYAAGAPLQSEILPIIFSNEFPDIQKSKIGKAVRSFINYNFVVNREEDIYPDLETVFGLLNYFIMQNEHLNAEYPNSKIRYIKDGLIKIIHYVISHKTEKQSKAYQNFWKAVCKYNRNISILTLNYDTLLEEAFDLMYPNYGYIDYCIHLMNYDKPEEMDDFNWWINPREPFPVWEGDPIPIKIMKAHGSLNWKYCRSCNEILLTPWDTEIDLFRGNFLHYQRHQHSNTNRSSDYRCPVDGTKFDTLILPPSHVKELSNPIISQIFTEALREIRSSKKVVFIGYSFPDADIHFKALFKKGIMEEKEIIVIDIDDSEEFKLNFKSLSNNLKFIKTSFEEIVVNDSIMQEILT